MSDFWAVITFAVCIYLSAMGVIRIGRHYSGYVEVKETFAVEQGYAEFVPDTTNGTIRFEWKEL